MKLRKALNEAELTDIVIDFVAKHNKKMNDLESKAIKQFERYIKVAQEGFEFSQIELSLDELDIEDSNKNKLLNKLSIKRP